MSDHIATVTAMYEAFGRGDIPSLVEHLADDVQWESWADNTAQTGGVPWMLPRTGKAGAAEFFRVIGEQLRIKDFRVLAIMAGGNQVAAEFVLEADVLATGGHYRDEEMHLWNFNDAGKVTRLRHYTDTAKHLKAAGKAE